MNKTAIKNFSIWARNKLIADIGYRAGLMGVTESGIADPLPQSTNMAEFYDIGTAEPYTISGIEVRQRKDLVDAIHRKEADSDYETAYNYIIEEVAYTWFNRLVAVRFMEVNDYLPSHIRVLSSESGKMEPDLVTTPFDADLEFTAEEEKQIINLKRENALDEMFRMLFVKQCNILNSILPGLFEKTGDYTELLLNLSVIDKDGVVYHLVHYIDEADFDVETKDENGNAVGQVEIIGWMYQYYNTEPKDETFALLKKNIKVTKERIPSATQLFTPDWIVRYMVENSLGRLWVEGHPNNELKTSWKYYLDEAEQEPDVEVQLAEIRKEHSSLNPEDIKVIDPCMGSGHILVYAFDVLMQIYETQGYTKQDAVKSILENNLYGLDIDERAAQLAYFAVMMKARSYDRSFFIRNIQPFIYVIRESNALSDKWLLVHKQMSDLFNCLKDAKEYGSIIELQKIDYNALRDSVINRFHESEQVDFVENELQSQLPEVLLMIDVAEILSNKYDIVVTNPPYMGSNGMSKKLSSFVKRFYPDGKSDLFSVFIERCTRMVRGKGYLSMITQHSWMFLSSYEKLRCKLLKQNMINMVHLGTRAFDEIGGEVVQTTSFVLQQSYIPGYKGIYCRLIEPITQQDKENMYLEKKNRFVVCQDNFMSLPGYIYAYWLSKRMLSIFEDNKTLKDYGDTKKGLSTSNNNRFIRFWYEVNYHKIHFNCYSIKGTFNSEFKWYPYIHGGIYRKWSTPVDSVVNFEDDAKAIKEAVMEKYPYLNSPDFVVKKTDIYFKPGIIWNDLAKVFNAKYIGPGYIFSDVTPIYMPYKHSNAMLAYFNSSVFSSLAQVVSQGIHYSTGHIPIVPCKQMDDSFEAKVSTLVEQNRNLCANDWNNFEISWDFQCHPLICGELTIAKAFFIWENACNKHFNQLKSNETTLNSIFIKEYGLENELSPQIEENDITVRKADLQRDIRSFLSYAVGCMFGRYSLDMDGLAYAGGEWDDSKYTSFQPDLDDIIPITDEEYLKDDIVSCLCQWLRVVYSEETLEENLDFIAQALGNKGDSSRDVIRNYFLKDFFTDHCKIYQKRPIYWQFDSGKQNGFKALVYLHRYTPDTIGNLRIDYLHRMQRIYDGEINRMQDIIEHSDISREVTKATKRKEKLQKQLKECQEYDEKISHLALSRIELNLDDGVKVNYEKLQTAQDGKKYQVLAKI